jgi:dihydrofolate synthase/folylpolyglutamate synthase
MSDNRSLQDWLRWQESLHVKEIDLGLGRIAQVLEQMKLGQPGRTVITVAGTNGKGSCVALLGSILASSGQRVAAYTSPHLLHYNERLLIDGAPVSDQQWCQAFEEVEQARAQIPLTYYEFGTLAALKIMSESRIDVALLEVGLGGRLDAVNVIDADCALITRIGIDHVDYLGPDRESIGREKAGIFRPNAYAVCADIDPPAVIADTATDVGARYFAREKDFGWSMQEGHWAWWGAGITREALPLPGLAGDWQLDNAAACLMVLQALGLIQDGQDDAVNRGLAAAKLSGRLQIASQEPEILLDVAHNPDSMSCLVQWLTAHPVVGKTRFVFAALADKDIAEMTAIAESVADCWYLAPLDVSRGLSVEQLKHRMALTGQTASVVSCESVPLALNRARQQAGTTDRIVVCGSFYTVSEAMSLLN